MTLFPAFHPPCLLVFSVVIFWGVGGYLFGIFHFLISNCGYSITYPTYVIYFSNFKSQRFSFFASFLPL